MGKSAYIIGIVGGMGPKASQFFEQKLIEKASAFFKGNEEQNYPNIINIALPHDIGDRTAFILGKSKKNPADEVFKILTLLNNIGDFYQKKVIATVPCNTFFSEKIFGTIREKIKNLKNILFIHWVDLTSKILSKKNIKDLFILSTKGEGISKVYEKTLKSYSLDALSLPKDLKERVHHCIYNDKWGIKMAHCYDKAKQYFQSILNEISKLHHKNILLGCTELSLVMPEQQYQSLTLLDPADLVADHILKYYYGGTV